MNRKIKVIELLNKIANGEEIPTKIKCKGKDFYFNKYEKSIDYLYRVDKDGNGWLVVQDIALTDEVEILDDNTEEIEELELIPQNLIENCSDRKFSYLAIKYNEILTVINQLRKEKK